MAEANAADVSIVNDLIETVLDSAKGYEEAAAAAHNPNFKSLFRTRSAERWRIASELQDLVRRLGGRPEEEGSVLASAHRMFLDLKHAVSGSDTGVVAEVERGEDHVRDRFERALDDARLGATSRTVLSGAYASIKNDHDVMRDLKHTMQSA